MFVEQPQANGPTLTVRPPLRLSSTPPTIRRGAPLLGEHSRELLTDLGYDDARIDSLIGTGVLGIPSPDQPKDAT
jgi:crotonobetainyl-CoA:carnitine CoA-transferase CaiB-like acyl-CoA transferase